MQKYIVDRILVQALATISIANHVGWIYRYWDSGQPGSGIVFFI